MRLKSKRLVSLLLAGSMMVSMVPASAVTAFANGVSDSAIVSTSESATNWASSGDCGATANDHVTYTLTLNEDGATYTLKITGEGAIADYNPYTSTPWLNGVNLYGRDIITKVEIAEGITRIGDNALRFNGATSIEIPKSVESIGVCALSGCASLEKFTVAEGNSNFYAEDDVLYENTAEGKVLRFYPAAKTTGVFVIPGDVDAIGEQSMQNALFSGLEIPASVASIGDYAFSSSQNLTEITIPATVTHLGIGVLKSGQSLQRVTLFANIDTIPDYFMQRCGQVTSFEIPNYIKKIGTYAFSESGLTSLEIDENSALEEISDNAFRICPNLASVKLHGKHLQKIGIVAFYNCPVLTDVDIAVDGNLELNALNSKGEPYDPFLSDDNITSMSIGSSNGTVHILNDMSKSKLQKIKLFGKLDIGASSLFSKTACNQYDLSGVTEITLSGNATNPFYSWRDGKTAIVYLNSDDVCAKINANNNNKFVFAMLNGGELPENTIFVENQLATPVKDGYRFEGWYTTKDFEDGTKVEDNTTVTVSQIYYAKWYEYNAVVDAEEKNDEAKINYVGSPIDIAVEVNAEAADVDSIQKADLIFDDINAVEKVEADGKELAKPYTNIDFGGLMNQSVATLAMVPVTKEPIILSVTFNTLGEHTVKIVLKDNANNVICSQDTTVKVVEKPILTFSDDCVVTVNGDEIKSGAEVEAGATVTVNLAKAVDSGMKFGSYVIDPIPEKVEYNDTTATFAMPAKNTSITLHLDPEDSDDSWDAATVITGVAIGAGAAVLTYHIGTELYAEQVLGMGVAVPKTREDVALKAWELAGKPAIELNGEPLSEAAQAEKWAVESGLMQNDAEGNFNGAKKMNKLKALRVLDKAQKLG